MTLDQRINAFSALGNTISKQINSLINLDHNPWYTAENVKFALGEISGSLQRSNLQNWLNRYPELEGMKEAKRIGVITAGNIPLVGFHDLLSVLISGHHFIGKLSSKDDKLLPAIIELLIEIEPAFKDYIHILFDKFTGFDAVIATGSNNTARYFDYYFGKYPHIIRKNRNSVAILTGNESEEDLQNLSDDIFLYFGLGCRSVSKLFVPDSFDLDHIFRNSLKHKYVIDHNKYANNYDYNRAVYMLNLVDFKDNGIMLLKEDKNYASPVSVVFYEYYSSLNQVKDRLKGDSEQIQCIVCKNDVIENSVNFGESQKPGLWDYADHIDTMDFLIHL